MSVSKRKKKHSTHSDLMRTPEFIQKVKQWWKLRSINEVNWKKLHVSEKNIRSVHEDIWYKSHVMKRGQFIYEKSKENRLNRPKRLLNKLKNPAKARMDGW